MKKRSLGQTLVACPYYIWAVIFVIVPVFVVIYYAFSDQSGNFTLSNIA